jgi:DNA-binding transcriptional LysR family regulator
MAEVRERLQGAAQIRIGASPIVFRDYLSPVIEGLRRQFPRLNMILRALNQPELIGAIEHNELDVVISLVPDNLSPGICSRVLLEMPLVLLASKSSKIKSANDLWQNGKVSEPLICLGPTELICQRFQETLAKLGIAWLPSIEMDSLDLIEKYVEEGYGIGLSIRVPHKKPSAKIRVLELPESPSVTLGVLYWDDANNDGVRRAFLDEVAKQAARFP